MRRGGMADALSVIRRELDRVRVIDPHCHVRADKPTADNLADIVLYHHVWVELVSAGLGQREVSTSGMPQELVDPGMEPLERVRRCLPHLAMIRNTTLGLFLSWILRDLYGLDGTLEGRTLERAFRTVEERGRDPGWLDALLRERCRVAEVVTVGPGEASRNWVSHGHEWGSLSIVSGKLEPYQVMEALERSFGRELRTAGDYRDGIRREIAAISTGELKFLGMWVPPNLSPELSRDTDVGRTLRRAREREPLSGAQSGGLSCFAVCEALEALRATPVRTVQIIAGAEVIPPHRALTSWSGELVGALARIASRFEDFQFNVSSASDQYTQDLGVLAKHVPNVSVAGHWWHTLYPSYVRKAVETRIDMVPMNKICAFFSDAYHSEWVYPKLRMVKEIWAEVLAERCAKGWCTVETACELVRKAFFENPRRIYGLSA